MNTIPTIIVPIDFTECSINALVNAIPIARKKQAQIIALHVIDTNVFINADIGSSLQYDNAIKSLETKYQNLLDQIKTSTQHYYQFEIGLMLKKGSISEAITEAANETNAFLIVIGTHGTGSKTSFLGSTAQSIVKEISSAVLAIPRSKKHSLFTKIFFPGETEQNKKNDLLKTISQNDDTIMEISELVKRQHESTLNDLNSKVILLENKLKEVDFKSATELQNTLKQLNQKTHPLQIKLTTISDTWDLKTISQEEKNAVPVFVIN